VLEVPGATPIPEVARGSGHREVTGVEIASDPLSVVENVGLMAILQSLPTISILALGVHHRQSGSTIHGNPCALPYLA
jgi:hypothetical protein